MKLVAGSRATNLLVHVFEFARPPISSLVVNLAVPSRSSIFSSGTRDIWIVRIEVMKRKDLTLDEVKLRVWIWRFRVWAMAVRKVTKVA
ncbi:hypothetical protein C1H46_003003 [Malus baccata]|uniref:Uncharacterized protein n=1 Tax=Malus baccata TaxID=106549 RepID=A0A540NLQ7_MALBA|nr:hypothetical protein C1H46_003002 [Malus baccata]TQE11440.1 hypothetical protein C1H46_003003 [Malus baccata]